MIISKQKWKPIQDANQNLAAKWTALQKLRSESNHRKAILTAEMRYLQALQGLNTLIQTFIRPQR